MSAFQMPVHLISRNFNRLGKSLHAYASRRGASAATAGVRTRAGQHSATTAVLMENIHRNGVSQHIFHAVSIINPQPRRGKAR
jgi:hypothetical protein